MDKEEKLQKGEEYKDVFPNREVKSFYSNKKVNLYKLNPAELGIEVDGEKIVVEFDKFKEKLNALKEEQS